MKNPNSPELLYISSDEDEEEEEKEEKSTLKWIRKFLDVEDDGKNEEPLEVDDDDDDDNDDDDCVVLDGDPDKRNDVEEQGGGEDGSGDDLVVVGEKGQVACRDFPHPRHLCAKFPFSSSGHEMHCDHCHCYVCDSLAPCVNWSTHCHASEKDAFWTSQRRSMRKVKVSMPIPAPEVHHIGISMGRPPMTKQSSPLEPNLVPQNQVPKQFTVRPCSMPTNIGVPKFPREGPPPGYSVPGSKYQRRLISQNLADASPRVSLTDRRHDNNTGPQRARFKRTVRAGSALASDKSGLNLSCLNYGSRLQTNLPAIPNWKGSHGGMTSVSHASQSSYLSNVGEVADILSRIDPVLGNRFSNTMLTPQMLSQQNRGSGNGNGILLQPQMASHQHITPGYTSYMPQPSSHCPVNGVSETSEPPQEPVSSRMPGNGNFRVSGPRRNHEQDIHGFMNMSPTPYELPGLTKQNEGRTTRYSEPTQPHPFRQFEANSESLAFPLPKGGSSSIDPFLPYQSPVYNQPAVIQDSHHSLQQGNQTISEALSSNIAFSECAVVSCTTPSTEQCRYSSQVQNVEPTDNYSANTNIYHQYPSPKDSRMTDFEAWLSVDHSVLKALEISVPPLLTTPIVDHSVPKALEFSVPPLLNTPIVDHNVPKAHEISVPPLRHTSIPSPELASMEGLLFD